MIKYVNTAEQPTGDELFYELLQSIPTPIHCDQPEAVINITKEQTE